MIEQLQLASGPLPLWVLGGAFHAGRMHFLFAFLLMKFLRHCRFSQRSLPSIQCVSSLGINLVTLGGASASKKFHDTALMAQQRPQLAWKPCHSLSYSAPSATASG